MKKKIIAFFILSTVVLMINAAQIPELITIDLEPNLNLDFFGSYNLTVNITNTSTIDTVYANISGINGDNISCWQFKINGTCSQNNPSQSFLSYDTSRKIWIKKYVRPDTIYPQIEFIEESILYHTLPSNISLNKFNYHLVKIKNNFTIVPNMSFWIEINAEPENVKSKDLLVYLIGNKPDSFFDSNWKTSSDIVLVSSRSQNDPKDHQHTTNASHYLIKLVTNNNGTFASNDGISGRKIVNISESFWLAIDSLGVQDKGWILQYRNDSICNTSNRWYTGTRAGWSKRSQSGCPDVHFHLARNTSIVDGVNITVYANYSDGNSTYNNSIFYFGALPNSPPNPTAFINPTNLTYNGLLNISWGTSIDPNEDLVSYNLTLLDLDKNKIQTLNDSTTSTFFAFDTTSIPDGKYDLLLTACDPSLACSNFTHSGIFDNFTIDNTLPNIKLNAPNTSLNATSVPIIFSFNYSDNNPIGNCMLVMNNITRSTISTSSNSTLNISYSPSSDSYVWYINCTDSASNLNSSQTRTLTVTLPTTTTTTSATTTTRSNGGSSGDSEDSYYLYEKSNKNPSIKILANIKKSMSKIIDIKENKNTKIKTISITAKNNLRGELSIQNLDKVPQHCNFPEEYNDYKKYKIIEFNTTINQAYIQNISVEIEVEKKWISENQISTIMGIKCYPEFTNIKSKLKQQNAENDTYLFESNGFSIWIILGSTEENDFSTPTTTDTTSPKRNQSISSYTTTTNTTTTTSTTTTIEKTITPKTQCKWVYFIIIIIIIVIIYKRKRNQKKIKRHKQKK